eukprot:1171811-Pyramimonas_sp.AAC.1
MSRTLNTQFVCGTSSCLYNATRSRKRSRMIRTTMRRMREVEGEDDEEGCGGGDAAADDAADDDDADADAADAAADDDDEGEDKEDELH